MILKLFLKALKKSEDLQIKLVFLILEMLTESTENELDDRALAGLRKVFGDVDTSDLK